MNKIFNKTSLLFYVLIIPNFFFLGLYFAKLTEVAKHQGLVGGAIVLMYSTMFAFIALIIAIILTLYVKREIIIKINRFLSIAFVCIMLLVLYTVITNEKTNEILKEPSKIPTKAVEPVNKSSNLSSLFQDSKMESDLRKVKLEFSSSNFYENSSAS